MVQQPMPKVDPVRCILCGDCIVACPVGALTQTTEHIVLDETRCAYCGDCEEICPVDAIALPYEITVDAKAPPSAAPQPEPPIGGL